MVASRTRSRHRTSIAEHRPTKILTRDHRRQAAQSRETIVSSESPNGSCRLRRLSRRTKKMCAIYLASRFSRIREMKAYAVRLQDLGHDITSRWVFRTERNVENLRSKEAGRVAVSDLEDVLRADTIIAFTEPPRSTTSRGGRHAEWGAAIGSGRHRLICVGGPENVFYSLPQVEHYPSFAALDKALTAERRALRQAA
jgi:hypothetical protein